MARRSDHSKEELEQLILDTAIKLVEKNGLEGLSARKLATKIKYTPGTIYSFYENLNELILRVNADTLDQIYAKLGRTSTRTCAGKEALVTIAKSYISYALDNHNRWKTLYEFSYPRAKGQGLPDWYEMRIAKNFSLIETQFHALGLKGEQCRLQAKIFWSAIHGITMLAMSGKMDTVKVSSVNALVEEFCRTYIKGL